MGSVQRLATVVIVGLVALSTILFLYLGDEDNRITAKEDFHQEAAIARAESNYVALCLQCHGPAGEGYTEPGYGIAERPGAPLGGVNTSLNQEGVLPNGTPWPGGVEARAEVIHDTIYNGLQTADGEWRMPAFGGAAGSLTDAQINELVIMIQNVDWNNVYNYAVEESGGYPTPPPPAATEAPDPDDGGEPSGGDGVIVIESHDIFFAPTEFEIPADTPVTVSLPNLGAAPHNFAIDELGISVDLAAGETKEVEINAPAGTYEFYCNVPGHREAGMVGTLTVTEGATMPEGSDEPAADDSGEAEATSEPESDEGAEAAEEPAATAAADEETAAAETDDGTSDAEADEGAGEDIAATGDVERGQQLAGQCLACHSVDGSPMVGPTWQGLYGSTTTLEGGETVVVDDAYLRESILDPTAQIVEGYPPSMPPYDGVLSDQDIADLIAYIKSLE